jgi:hypothetical protein
LIKDGGKWEWDTYDVDGYGSSSMVDLKCAVPNPGVPKNDNITWLSNKYPLPTSIFLLQLVTVGIIDTGSVNFIITVPYRYPVFPQPDLRVSNYKKLS